MFPWALKHLLSILIFSPLLGVAILMSIPKKYEEAASEVAIVGSGLPLFVALVTLNLFDFKDRFAFFDSFAWLPSLGTSYSVGIDGLSALLILLVAVTVPIVVLAFWKKRGVRQRELFISLLLFEVGAIGFFSSLDIFLMFVFMEIGVAFLCASILFMKGEGINYSSALVQFVAFSSLIFLTVVALLMWGAGTSDLLIVEKVSIASKVQVPLAIIFLVAVFLRMGLFPFHSWVIALTEGERGHGSFFLVGILWVFGAYILYRFLPPFALALTLLRPVISWVVVSSIIISALISFVQGNITSLFAYIFMAELGFVLLGGVSLSSEGLAGSCMLMVETPFLILATSVLLLLHEKRGILGIFFLIILLALTGLPALSHFPGLFMVWMGLFKGGYLLPLTALVAVVFISASLIGVAGKTLYRGSLSEGENTISWKEIIFVIPFVVLIVGIGIFPDEILVYIKQSTEATWQVFLQQI